MEKEQAYELVISDLEKEHEALLERANNGEDVNAQGQELSEALIFLVFRQSGLSIENFRTTEI